MDRSTLGERASDGQNYLRRESQPWTDLPNELEPSMDRSTVRESQPWTDQPQIPDKREREQAMDRSTDERE